MEEITRLLDQLQGSEQQLQARRDELEQSEALQGTLKEEVFKSCFLFFERKKEKEKKNFKNYEHEQTYTHLYR